MSVLLKNNIFVAGAIKGPSDGTQTYNAAFEAELVNRGVAIYTKINKLKNSIPAVVTKDIGNTMTIIGDSRSVANDLGTSVNARGYLVWANALLGQRIKVIHNAAVGGTTTSTMRATLDAALSYGAALYAVLGGTNDVASGTITTDKSIENLWRIYEKIRATGATVLCFAEYPASGVYTTTAKKEAIFKINRAIRDYAYDNDRCIFINGHEALVDPTSATGDELTAYSYDGIHLSTQGAIQLGRYVANALDPVLPKQRPVMTSLADVISSTNETGNIVVNGMMNGIVGVESGLGMSGDTADGWTLQLVTGAATVTSSKVARTDGVPGFWQRLTISGSADNTRIRLMQIVVLPAQVAPGNVVEGYAEFVLSSVVGNVDAIYVQVEPRDAANATIATQYYPTTFESGIGNLGSALSPCIFPTGKYTLPSLTARIQFGMNIQVDNLVTCVLDIGVCELRKVI